MSAFLDITQLGRPIDTLNKDEIRYNCIYCDDDNYKLYVNTKKRVYHCFRCGAKGRTNIIASDLENILLTPRHQLYNPPDILKLPRAYRDILTPAAVRYLSSRGIYESDVRWHKIYSAAPNTIYFGRIIIPCNVRQGYCDYFVARGYTRIVFPKYLNPPNPRRNLFLSPERSRFQEKWERYWGDSELVLVEGPFDYLKASRHGPCAALLGKELKLEQANEIVSLYSKVYILLDQGLPEQIASLKIRDILAAHVDVEILQCPKKDPGEMNEKDFQSLFN